MESFGRLRADPDHLWLIAGSMRRVRVTLRSENGTDSVPGALTLECGDGLLESLVAVSTAGHEGFAVSATKRCETCIHVSTGEHHLAIPVTVLASAAFRLEKISGDHQTAIAGRGWPTPVVVRAEDRYGNPVTGQRVVFALVDEASGETDALFECETNQDGYARWGPLAMRPGVAKVNAHVAYRRFDDLGPRVSFLGLVTRDGEKSPEP